MTCLVQVLKLMNLCFSKDVVLCRTGRALERRIKGAKEGQVKATVKYWEGAWEVEEYYMSLLS